MLLLCVNCVISFGHFCCLFSYYSLLEWHYGDKRSKTLTTKEWENVEGLSIHEMECCMDVNMILDEYTYWDAKGLLQEMFLQATHMGTREAE